jgi:hypothetical protein
MPLYAELNITPDYTKSVPEVHRAFADENVVPFLDAVRGTIESQLAGPHYVSWNDGWPRRLGGIFEYEDDFSGYH